MKKLFTLVALLAVFLGAKAEWVEDYKIDYSTYTGFPFYVMGYVPNWNAGIMTDLGNGFKSVKVEGAEETSDVIIKTSDGTEYYTIEVEGDKPFHQYFIADGIPTELDGAYTVKALVKASAACTINVNMGWGWNEGQQTGASVAIPASDDFVEVQWEYSGIGGTSCNLVAQNQTATKIEWKSLVVGHNAKPQRPTTWQEWLNSDGKPFILDGTATNTKYMGDAETPWSDPNVKYNDAEKNYLICAWSKEKGHNVNENEGWDPFPATITVDPKNSNNHVFVCHGQPATTENPNDANAYQWDNQFWIESPCSWKEGTQIKVHFRYMASKEVKTATQIHNQTPSDYLHWQAVGDVSFTEEWQDFDKTFTIDGSMNGGWSIAFNLNANDKAAIDFYFDDLSWQTMKLDEGYFVAGCNTATGLEYDFDNAIEFTEDEESGCLVATIGEKNAYVSQIMISTIRGNDAAFKGATLKPSGSIQDDADIWLDYTEASVAKLNLPGAGIWKIWIDTEFRTMAFKMLEGDVINPVDVFTFTDEIVVNGKEREDLKDSKGQDGTITVREDADDPAGVEIGGEGHNGEAWDNQFFIKANRALEKGTVTKLVFKYKSSVEAKTSTQCHGETPGAYMHYAAIGEVTFKEDWDTFEQEFTIPNEADGMWNIAFNMAEIKEACDYYIKDVQWYLVDESLEEGKTYENLISGAANFYKKEGAGTDPYVVTGIANVVTKNAKSSNATYNLAGQRVSKDFKGIVIKNGQKFMNK